METKKQLAFIVKIILKIVCNQIISDNEIQSLDNIACDLGIGELKDDEFRY